MVSRRGAYSDEKIKALLGHIPGVTTQIVGMDETVLNQQRALWLTPDKARNIVIDRNIKLLGEKIVRKKKANAKEFAASEKRRAADLASQVENGTLQGQQEITSTTVDCKNECGAIE